MPALLTRILYRPEPASGLLDRLDAPRLARDAACQPFDRRLARERAQLVLAARDCHHALSALGQQQRGRAADAATRSGHERDATAHGSSTVLSPRRARTSSNAAASPSKPQVPVTSCSTGMAPEAIRAQASA